MNDDVKRIHACLEYPPCDQHPDPHDCADIPVIRTPYGYALPVRDGGTSVHLIDYCPWCGERLPTLKNQFLRHEGWEWRPRPTCATQFVPIPSRCGSTASAPWIAPEGTQDASKGPLEACLPPTPV